MYLPGIGGALRVGSGISAAHTNNREPDWSVVPHKGMERPSDQELDIMIDSLARALGEAIAKGDDQTFYELRAYAEKQLLAQYISAVSPDRKGMAEEAAPLIKLAMSGQLTPDTRVRANNDPQTLFDYLCLRDGLRKPVSDSDRMVSLESTGAVFQYGLSSLQPDMFNIKLGALDVLSYDGAKYGWSWTATSLELAKKQEYLGRLNALQTQYSRQYGAGTQGAGAFDRAI